MASNQAQQTLDFQEWTYDERNRLTLQESARGNLSYAYDVSSNLTGLTSSNANGVELTYAYDVLNRLERVFDTGASQPPLEHSYTYNAVGNLDTLTYANGVVHDWDYNTLNRLTNLNLSNGFGSLNSYIYTLRDSGHRSRQTETSGRVVDYTYDNLYRLTSETITNDPYAVVGGSNWTYDLVGNRLNQTSTISGIVAQNESYSANDWLDSDAYDSNGNTTLSDSNADVYDFMNRLIQRTTSGGDVIAITYDTDGNRISKSTSAGVTHYLVDVNNLTGYAQVLEELNSALTVERVYTYGLDLIAQHQLMPSINPTEWQTNYYLYDGLGTVRGLADDTGLVSDAYFYDAWGNLLNLVGMTPNLYLFTGEQWDADLGMYFLRARYMNPETGRMHSMDTWQGDTMDPITLHKYLYANVNPASFIDPTGNISVGSLMLALWNSMKSIGRKATTAIRNYFSKLFPKSWKMFRFREPYKAVNPLNSSQTLKRSHSWILASNKSKRKRVRFEKLPLNPDLYFHSLFGDRSKILDGIIIGRPYKKNISAGTEPEVSLTNGQYKIWRFAVLGSGFVSEKSCSYSINGNACHDWANFAIQAAKIIRYIPYRGRR